MDTTCFANSGAPCTPNSGASNNRSAVFTLGCGPATPAAYCNGLTQGPLPFDFGPILSAISSNGTLPLLGPAANTSPNIRPGIQRLPTVDQWNATVQRQLTSTLNLTVSYVGNKGTHVFAGQGPSYNSNEIAVGPGTNLVTCSGGNCSLGGFNPAQPQADRRRLFLNGVPAFTYGAPFNYTCCAVDLNYNGNDASDSYEALQIKAEKRVSAGLQFLAHYTFSHAYAYDSGYYSVDRKIAYGPNPANRNHVFVANTIYELPIGKGKKFFSDVGRVADLLVGGWQITNTLNWSGGLPFTPSIGECGEISDAGPCRPDLLPGQSFSVGKRTAACPDNSANTCIFWFTPVAPLSYGSQISVANAGVDSCTFARPTSGPFALPGCGKIGNVGIFSFRGPHSFFSDMALSKKFNITERYRAEFRFDAYNVFNHPVLGFNANQGNLCVDCGGNAGQVTDIQNDNSPGSPTGMRQLQFGFRFTF